MERPERIDHIVLVHEVSILPRVDEIVLLEFDPLFRAARIGGTKMNVLRGVAVRCDPPFQMPAVETAQRLDIRLIG